MMQRPVIRRSILLACLSIALFGTMARAQYENGSLNGTIHDATGAVVGNATVTVTNVSTGIVNTTRSNGSGDYEFPSLRVGVYTVQAEAQSFEPAEAKNITISVGGRQR